MGLTLLAVAHGGGSGSSRRRCGGGGAARGGAADATVVAGGEKVPAEFSLSRESGSGSGCRREQKSVLIRGNFPNGNNSA